MNLEDVREFALSLNLAVDEMLFGGDWVNWQVGGKWFLVVWLNAPEPRIAVKLPPDTGEELRMFHQGVRPPYHLNKKHWNDLYLNLLPDEFVKEQIRTSFRLVAASLPKKRQTELGTQTNI